MPEVLETDFTKADIPTLQRDIPKWYPVMPQSAKDWWDVFMEGFGEKTSHASADEDCPLYQLKNCLNRAKRSPADNGDIPEELTELRENELAPLEEVLYVQHSYFGCIHYVRSTELFKCFSSEVPFYK